MKDPSWALTGPSPAGVISTPAFSKFNPQISQARSVFPLLLPQASCWAQGSCHVWARSGYLCSQEIGSSTGERDAVEVVPSLPRALTPKVGQSALLPKS